MSYIREQKKNLVKNNPVVTGLFLCLILHEYRANRIKKINEISDYTLNKKFLLVNS